MIYHWSDKDKLNRDNKYLTNLYEKYLIFLSNILNKFHKENKDIKYWRIIIGPWLRFFIDIVFDRYETLKENNTELPKNYKLDNKKLKDLRSKDFKSFFNNCCKERWNKNLFNLLKGQNPIYLNKKTKLTQIKNIFFIKNLFKNLYIYLINPFSRSINKDILIIDPYIKLNSLIKFIVSSRILPYFIKSRKYKGNAKWDNYIINITEFEFSSNFEEILKNLILIYIPSIYTDNFIDFKSNVLKDVKTLPKIIFTSNGYQANEEFKIIAAETYINSGKILIGQHGGNMGLAKFNQAEEHQILISDRFYSYGWGLSNNKKVFPMPSMQLSSLDSIIPKRNGSIVNVMGSFPKYFYTFFSMPLGPEYIEYINFQKELTNFLRKDISSRLIHRLNGDEYGWNATNLLKERGLKVSETNISFKKQLSKSCLCIISYNSTAALETLSINFPTLLYWPNNLFEIRKESLYYFECLKEVGIFHTSAISAGNQLNIIMDDIDGWWEQNSVQKARNIFVSRFASTNKDWIKNWHDELKSQSK